MPADRILAYFQKAGWRVTSPDEGDDLGADFFIARGGRSKAILVRDEPPGPFEIARFGHGCRRRGITGVVVAPDDPSASDLADQAGLEFLGAEGILVREPAAVLPPVVMPPPPQPIRAPRPTISGAAMPPGVPRWRWAVVAVIWTAALLVVAYDLMLLMR